MKCQFNFTCGSDIPEIPVEQDKMIQLLNNLLLNATEASPEGGKIYIELQKYTLTNQNYQNFSIQLPGVQKIKEGDYIHLRIQDSGQGIPREMQENIFSLYYTTKSTGHGLGLATCYSIVMMYSGYISFQSIENHGTTFHVFLPITKLN
jgi:signal transduction histidine kinase